MAPRRGGSYGGGGSIDIPSCADYAFYQDYSKILIAFDAFYFLVFLVLFFSAFAASRTWRKGHASLWVPLILAITFMLFTAALSIVFSALTECRVPYLGFGATGPLVIMWLKDFSTMLLLGAIMIPLCKQIHKAIGTTGMLSNTKTGIHIGWFTLTVILVLAGDAITTKMYDLTYALDKKTDYAASRENTTYGDYDTVEKLDKHSKPLGLVINIFVLFGVLLVCVDLVMALAKRSSMPKRGNLGFFVGLIVGSLGWALTDLAWYAYIRYSVYLHTRSTAKLNESSEAQYFLRYFFFALASFSAVKVAAAVSGGVSPARLQPVGQLVGQASVPYQFQQPTSPPQQSYNAYSPPPAQNHFQSGFSNEIRQH